MPVLVLVGVLVAGTGVSVTVSVGTAVFVLVGVSVAGMGVSVLVLESELLEWMRARHSGLLADIRDSGQLPEGDALSNTIAEFKTQFVSSTGDRKQFCSSRDKFQRCRHLVDRTKPISHTMNEQRRSFDIRKMSGTQLLRALWRMQGVREQKEVVCKVRFSRSKY